MIILGIDPGTGVLGYSLLHYEAAGKPSLMVMDVLYLRKIDDMGLRLRKIFDTTRRIIDSYHPDHLAIEAPFAGKNVQSMIKLGKAQGVAIAAALSRDLSYTEYEPAAVKQRVTGNGVAAKEQVAMVLQSLFGFEQTPHYLDATDALAVAYTGYLELTDPLAGVRAELKSHRTTRGRRATWGDFVSQNPDRINN